MAGVAMMAGMDERVAGGAGWWGRVAPFLPWTDGTGRAWRGWRAMWWRAPFVPLYLVASWLLFVPNAERTPGNYSIEQDRVDRFLYHIPDLTDDFFRALSTIVTAPWLNHNLVQLVYVTILLALFGVAYEAREGTARMVAIFFGTAFVGAVVAGLLLHLIYPEAWDTAFTRKAWNRTWSGGSAGAFGVMGAFAARARRPWPLLALFVLWEVNVVVWYLREYTPAFHLTALLTGFAVTRYGLTPWRRRGLRTEV